MSEEQGLATFKSADGTLRCLGCGLHDDTCTCDPRHPVWEAFGVSFAVSALASRLSALIREGGK